MGALIEKLAFNQPSCSYDKTLDGLHFVSRTEEVCIHGCSWSVNECSSSNHDRSSSVHDRSSFIHDCSAPSTVQRILIPIRYCHLDDNYPTVIWCHANSQDIGQMNINALASSLNANIILFDYAGYGMHSKRVPTEEDCYKDVETVYYQFALPIVKNPRDIAIVGHSLGSAAAVHLAFFTKNDVVKPSNLLLISPLYSGAAVKVWYFPSFLDKFKNYAKAPFIKIATSIYHGEQDSVIPIECAKELSFLFPHLVRFHNFQGLDHETIMNEKILWQSLRHRINLA